MALKNTLNRRVKPHADISEDEFDAGASDASSPSVLDTGEGDDDILSSGDEDEHGFGDEEEDEEDASGPEEEVEDVQQKLSSIDFGTLAKAQDSLSRKRKRGSDTTAQQEDKLEALRARLRELREEKGVKEQSKKSKASASSSRKQRRDDDSEEDDDDESDDARPKSRSSKHAPAAMPSNRQVTRKRTVIDAPKRKSRDPRFGPLSGAVDDAKLQKNYAFLNDYQASEIAELKAAIKKTKNEDDKEVLKRKLLSMESKRKARENKEREQEVLRAHRREEKDAIQQGKKPFYLKKSEQKKLATVNKFNSMKSKEREKLMERRRKKAAGKEKRNMPQARRTVG
ncbi:rRNA biogenesis protein rrp36 [Taxawa tesnikishii (nom. ined.)]|nr:rRNA biogenesis protein rrp36 [Dothideales sp. JES 119]